MTDVAGPPESRRPNHLAGQSSPYLLQHLYNPVDWHAWGPEALEKAKREDKPIFLSIGYAACHWCHVMERETFEDEAVAELLGRGFVSIKVDREERPDIDEIYMNAVQLMTGQGGWPLSVFLTPDLRPFMGGTYFPPERRGGMIGFTELVEQIHAAWVERREEIGRSSEELTERLRIIAAADPGATSPREVGREESARAAFELSRRFDSRWGGFGAAPKFPPDGAIGLLLREHERTGQRVPLDMAELTLERMARGGMYDQVGGGFARYSVDERWLVPHFEKMLYNQALLVPLYLDAWLITSRPLYRRVAEQTLDFVRRELTDAEGGFHASLDADSDGQEGSFYVWTPDEVVAELGAERGRLFCEIYGIEPSGNFEGRSIPNLLAASLAERAAERGLEETALDGLLAPSRDRLLEARARRTRPGTDDKVLTAWTGLMIGAFARAFQTLGRAEDLLSARRAADFALSTLARGDRLRVTYRDGTARLNGYLDDYAFLARGLLDLYEADFDSRHLDAARRLAGTIVERFEDAGRGGFFFVSDDHEALLARSRSLHDGALPSGAGVAAETLLRLGLLFDDAALRDPALRMLRAYQPLVARAPSGCSAVLTAADFSFGPVSEIALVGAREDDAMVELLAAVRRRYLPRRVIACIPPGVESNVALLAGKQALGGRATAYVCRDYACGNPTTDREELDRLLDEGFAD
jgi:uncharacterized protein YyaL (SSP411 family)